VAGEGLAAGELAQLRRMADQWACQKLHERYWYAEAARDVDMVCSVFTDDARYGRAIGIEAIRETVQGYMAAMSNIAENYHLIPIAADISVDADTAEGEVRGVGFIRLRQPDGSEKVMGLGVGYVDRFLRTPDGWRICSMHGIEDTEAAHDTTWSFVIDSLPHALGDVMS
jgi:ketosteroid isomerase-like protein